MGYSNETGIIKSIKFHFKIKSNEKLRNTSVRTYVLRYVWTYIEVYLSLCIENGSQQN